MEFIEILTSSLGLPSNPAIIPNNSSSSSQSTMSGNTTATLPTPQIALIDFLIPGFTQTSTVIRQYSGVDISLYIPFLAVVLGCSFIWGRLSVYAWQLIDDHLTSSVRIRTDDEIYNIIIAWIAQQNFSKHSRRFIANTNINSRNYYSYDSDSDSEDEGEYAPGENSDDGPANARGERKPLHYTPSYGHNYFFYGRRLMLFQRDQKREGSSPWASSSSREELIISSFGRSPDSLKRLLCEAREQYMKKDETKTIIYRGSAGTFGGDPSWQRCMSRSTRPLSTVILDEKVKKDLVDDVADYLNPATRRWYTNRGIPYRRGYLLHGPPGTGKSSLSLALAGHFRMRIYIVSLSSVVATEESLASLFVDLPRRCLVLLEDIDSAGLTHLRDDTEGSSTTGSSSAPSPAPVSEDALADGAEGPMPPPSSGGGRLSLSGLLNILDGVASQEGRLLVMTTNHLEKLDKALVRPGRVDRIVHFGLADAKMASSVFRAIYALYDGEKDPHSPNLPVLTVAGKNADESEAEEAKAASKARIEKLATEFGERLPSLEFSPAEIQGLLLRYKRDPEAVLGALDEWVEKTRSDKKEKEIEEAEKRRKDEEARLKKVEEEKKAKDEEKAEEEKEKEKVKNTEEKKAREDQEKAAEVESEVKKDEKGEGKQHDAEDKK